MKESKSRSASDGIFDLVPMDQMTDAEAAVRAAAENLSAEIQDRLQTADALSDKDRKEILKVARDALNPFQSQA